jgi:hypothetical protein
LVTRTWPCSSRSSALAGQQQSQANGGKQEQRSATAEGTPEELAMCKNLNLTLEQFRAGAEAV